MNKINKRILASVQKPARYTGGENNAVVKNKESVALRFAFCFPDIYEIGMSHLGLRILYGVMNEREDIWCERVFAPWTDMEEALRKNGSKLFALESGDPLCDFDIVGFTLQYEMSYSAVLNMLDLGGITVRREERGEDEPLVVAGGPCTYNPEPLADFIDIFNIGEGEEQILELCDLYKKCKAEGKSKKEFLREAVNIKGLYIPSLYDVEYNDDGTIASVTAKDGAPDVVVKRIIEDFDKVYVPKKVIVPSTEIVHDRVSLEVFRGCIRGCRFCQAGYAYRPVRAKHAETLIEHGKVMCEESGYEEISLASLSTSDYKELPALADGLLDWCEPRNISLQLPSLRADNFSVELMQRIQKVRSGGLTFAPEAGSARLRDAINKNLTEEEIMNACRIAFENGRSTVKLYFMIGLPTETDEDIKGIASLAQKILWLWKTHATNKKRGVKITVSAACFVPKPHTPFQWEAQNTREEFARKAALLREAITAKTITYNWHEPDVSFLEAAFARGDRRLGRVIETAWKKGARLDGWAEHFSLDLWLDAFRECGIDPAFHATRARGHDEILPWDHISTGVTKNFLACEREKAYRSEASPNCREKCLGCGASKLLCGGKCDA
ncbi:MAG: TIGR03960 family B12-binding radical SAM protein [Oscillospiraceae bacterium]|nr:TIGR03960 family B12-binding radical SAM protein [Oscillospiraceae bacterium]